MAHENAYRSILHTYRLRSQGPSTVRYYHNAQGQLPKKVSVTDFLPKEVLLKHDIKTKNAPPGGPCDSPETKPVLFWIVCTRSASASGYSRWPSPFSGNLLVSFIGQCISLANHTHTYIATRDNVHSHAYQIAVRILQLALQSTKANHYSHVSGGYAGRAGYGSTVVPTAGLLAAVTQPQPCVASFRGPEAGPSGSSHMCRYIAALFCTALSRLLPFSNTTACPHML